MVTFPNAKINLGLNILRKREDQFHELHTVFYPIGWCDALEILPAKTGQGFTYKGSGLGIDVPTEKNILYKAWTLLNEQYKLPAINVHLHKAIPMGAGLGGGSADAAFFINQVNQQFKLSISEQHRVSLAARLGSDCAFFIKNQSSFAQGRGELLEPINVDLSRYFILVAFPGIHSTTAAAFSKTIPKTPAQDLKDIVCKRPVNEWKDKLVNDFETSIFSIHPQIAALKEELYNMGALYASLSGSGSSVYGIFEEEPDYKKKAGHSYYLQRPANFLGKRN